MITADFRESGLREVRAGDSLRYGTRAGFGDSSQRIFVGSTFCDQLQVNVNPVWVLAI